MLCSDCRLLWMCDGNREAAATNVDKIFIFYFITSSSCSACLSHFQIFPLTWWKGTSGSPILYGKHSKQPNDISNLEKTEVERNKFHIILRLRDKPFGKHFHRFLSWLWESEKRKRRIGIHQKFVVVVDVVVVCCDNWMTTWSIWIEYRWILHTLPRRVFNFQLDKLLQPTHNLQSTTHLRWILYKALKAQQKCAMWSE